MPTHYDSIEEIKAANEAKGDNWFSPNTLRFFKSEVYPEVYGERYFVTSEKNDGYGYSYPRLYSVRIANEDGSIDTVGEFQAYGSLREARRAAARIARETT
jgi:hypothetical protein